MLQHLHGHSANIYGGNKAGPILPTWSLHSDWGTGAHNTNTLVCSVVTHLFSTMESGGGKRGGAVGEVRAGLTEEEAFEQRCTEGGERRGTKALRLYSWRTEGRAIPRGQVQVRHPGTGLLWMWRQT